MMEDFAQFVFAFSAGLIFWMGKIEREKVERDFYFLMFVLMLFSASFAYILK